MKKLVVLGWLCVFACQAGQDIYSAHERKAYKKALGLVALYYGIDHQLTAFHSLPGGGFELQVTQPQTNETRTLFLLADLEHVIEGVLLSPLDVNAENQVITPLKKLAAHNQQIKQQLSDFKQQITSTMSPPLPVTYSADTGAKQTDPDKTNTEKSNTEQSSAPLVGNTAATYLKSPFNVESTPARSPFLHDANELNEHYSRLKNLNHFSWGTGNKVLFVFVDLNCPACRQAHSAIEKNINQDEVTIYYIPVGILGQDSEVKASLVLAPNENDDRIEAFDYLFQKAKASELVDISVDRALVDQGWQRYKENTLAFLNLPRPVTPTFAVMSEQGPVIRPAVNASQIQSMIDMAITNNGKGDEPNSAGY